MKATECEYCDFPDSDHSYSGVVPCRQCGKKSMWYDMTEHYDPDCVESIIKEWEDLKKEVAMLRKSRVLKFRLPEAYADDDYGK